MSNVSTSTPLPELDEILERIHLKGFRAGKDQATGTYEDFEAYNKAADMEAILDWHNKRIEEVIKKPHILPKNAQHQESVKQGINFYHRQMRKRVDKLKESK